MSSGVKLSIRNLKCFAECDITFSPITVFTGTNSSGKTTILQSLLLLRDFSDKNVKEQHTTWPATVGGIPIGSKESFVRAGERSSPEVTITDGRESSAFECDQTSYSMSLGDVGFLMSVWRVFATMHLPLRSEQDVGQRDLRNDSIYDHLHSLLELNEFQIKRKGGSLEPRLTLRGSVERMLGTITVPTRVDLLETELEAKLRLSYSDTAIESELLPPEQYGTGVTAILPLTIHLCAALSGEVLVVQDPEAHLHPRGQSAIGRELAICCSRGVSVIVETHSEHVINGIKLGLLDLGKSPELDLGCYYLDRSEGLSSLVKVVIDDRGLTRNWPPGFFDQAEIDLSALSVTARKKIE